MTPNVDFDNLSVNMLPIEQRKPFWIIMVLSCMSPIQRQNFIFRGYMNGESYGLYNAGTTYLKGQKSQFMFATWESKQDGNTGNTPDISPDYWEQRNSSFIGVNERIKYNGRKLIFEYALNRYFGTTFRQPDDAYNPTPSEIFIDNDPPVYTSFMLSAFGATPISYMYAIYSTGVLFAPPIFPVASFYQFTINIPVAVYTALGATAEQIVRQFADKYAIAGTQYTIQTY